jgi:Methyltransferase domain
VIEDRIAALDTELFKFVESQTDDNDRKSFLALHNAIAAQGQFSYLEIGSHLGGTLQTVLADPRCVRVVSIDPRPQWQPDDRPELDGWAYPDNTTERMLDLLRSVPGADLSKLETAEESTENLAPGRFARPDFCLVDGEHTRRAALRDARFCRAVMQGAGIVAFHDFNIIGPAILAFLREASRPHRAYLLRSTLFVVELGTGPTLLTDPNVRSQLHTAGWWIAANRLAADTALLTAHLAGREVKHRVRTKHL